MRCWLWSAASTSFATCVLAFCKFSVIQHSFKIRQDCKPHVGTSIMTDNLYRLWFYMCLVAVVHTSKVSVEILQPPDFSHQPPPQCLLQVFSLTAALHQCLIGL